MSRRVELFRPVGTQLLRRGRSPVTPTDRDSLIPGSYWPDSSNTGLTDPSALTVYTGSATLTTPNTTYRNLKFTQNMDLRAANVKFYNCWFAADSSDPRFCIRTETAACQNAYFESCLIRPEVVTVATNCISGANFTLKYCDVNRGVDCVRCYYPPEITTAPLNIRIIQSYLHHVSFFLSDPNQSGGPTHSDVVQLQGSDATTWGLPPTFDSQGRVQWRNVAIFGSTIEGVFSKDTGDYNSIPDRGTGSLDNGRYNTLNVHGLQVTPVAGHATAGLDIWRTKFLGGFRGINAGSVLNTDVGSVWMCEFDDAQGGRRGSSTDPGTGWCINMDATTTWRAGDGIDGADTSLANRYLASIPVVGGQPVTVLRNQ